MCVLILVPKNRAKFPRFLAVFYVGTCFKPCQFGNGQILQTEAAVRRSCCVWTMPPRVFSEVLCRRPRLRRPRAPHGRPSLLQTALDLRRLLSTVREAHISTCTLGRVSLCSLLYPRSIINLTDEGIFIQEENPSWRKDNLGIEVGPAPVNLIFHV